MKPTVGLPSAAVLAAAAVLTALLHPHPAAAEPSAVGTYTFDAEDGETATWNLTPCAGDASGCIRVSESGNSQRAPWSGEAHYSVGSWIMFVEQPDAILCEDGTSVPGRNTYSWDNSTLAGNASIFSRGACGNEAMNVAIGFRLSKTGSIAVQAPPAAADVPAQQQAAAGPLPQPAPPPPPAELLPAESPAGN
jgi:hypothetical protein